MRRAKLGDVYCIEVPNGYKLFQWAYKIPKRGEFMRVFDGLYKTIPNDIEAIVKSQHSYIIAFYIQRAYRIGLAQFLGNYAVPEEYPFPKYQINFSVDSNHKLDAVHVMNSDGKFGVSKWHEVGSMDELPEPYRDVTLLSSYLTPNWLLYLFDKGFDLKHPERYFPGQDIEEKLKPYDEIISRYWKGK